ncbi:hypothetical protein NM208_g9533 [Fusarium decemcellulare]|uniref:Uncharacterized protein n=1 Tax=Fusarium decemcellulare TaxID=57161 RepID=A0ACC1S1B4_9HYPO|nr:hypothetical protein NM208_g9533 [Fusarium decemcellulare]
MPAPLIWINAFPGTGKLAVARAVAALYPQVIVIDNHRLIDPVAMRLSRDDPRYQPERKRERERAFAQYVLDPTRISQTILFTDFQSTSKLGQSVAEEYQAAARQAGRPFMPVYLSCDLNVNIYRMLSGSRVHGGTTKLTDPDILRNIRRRSKVFQFEDEPGRACSIDTTAMEPTDVFTVQTVMVALLMDADSAGVRMLYLGVEVSICWSICTLAVLRNTGTDNTNPERNLLVKAMPDYPTVCICGPQYREANATITPPCLLCPATAQAPSIISGVETVSWNKPALDKVQSASLTGVWATESVEASLEKMDHKGPLKLNKGSMHATGTVPIHPVSLSVPMIAEFGFDHNHHAFNGCIHQDETTARLPSPYKDYASIAKNKDGIAKADET